MKNALKNNVVPKKGTTFANYLVIELLIPDNTKPLLH